MSKKFMVTVYVAERRYYEVEAEDKEDALCKVDCLDPDDVKTYDYEAEVEEL